MPEQSTTFNARLTNEPSGEKLRVKGFGDFDFHSRTRQARAQGLSRSGVLRGMHEQSTESNLVVSQELGGV